MTAPDRLRILHLEDNAADAELVERHLREAGLRFDAKLVATREAFVRALDEFRPDVILADDSLADFDGFSAIRLVRQKDPDVPFIVVAGVLGDEAAVGLIKAGANDYIFKDRLGRLPAAVKQAADAAEQSRARKRAEDELRLLNTELERRVAARTEELREANRIKDDLIEREHAISMELERLRRYDAEVGLRIQQTLLLDPPPNLPGLKIAALTVPSQQIDGDFYIFFPQADHTLDFVVGDVMGKGIPAALMAAGIKSQFLKALAYMTVISDGNTLPDPRDIVMLAHAQLGPEMIELESFASLCYVRLDLDRRIVAMVDCGHTGMLHWHAAIGRCEILHGDNPPLGVREGEIFSQIAVPFAPEDLLLFFSDGITEARDEAGELFGPDRLIELVRANAGLDPPMLVQSIHKAAAAFARAGRLADDLTSVCLRIGQPPAKQRDAVNIRSNPRELHAVREFVRRFCAERVNAIPAEPFVDALELAVSEATSNIMRHAYRGRPDQWIRVEAEVRPDAVAVRLTHLGGSFIPREAPRVPDGTRDVGFGTYIMARGVDQVLYERDELGRNSISLIKLRTIRKDTHSDGTGNR